MIYYCSLILSMIFVYLSNRIKKPDLIIQAFICSLPLSIVSGFRYAVGTDFFSYVKEFYSITGGAETRFEPLFVFLVKCLGFLELPVQAFFILTSLLICLLFFVVIFRDSKNRFFSVYLFFTSTLFFMQMNGIRQVLAISIAYIGLKYIYEGNFKKYIFAISIASLFHYSCLCMIPFYFLRTIRLNAARSLLTISIVALLSTYISDFIVQYVSQIDYYGHYLDQDAKPMEIWLYVALSSSFFSIFFLDEDSIVNRTYYAFQLMIILLSFFVVNIPILNRLLWVFFPSILISIPNSLNLIKNKRFKILISGLIYILFGIYSYTSIFVNGSHDASNYRFFFDM